jgi:hypothetical protein
VSIGHPHHSVWTKIASTLLVAAGLRMLWSYVSIASVASIAYGAAGIGLDSIARGTVPLSIYGAQMTLGLLAATATLNLAATGVVHALIKWAPIKSA